MKTPHDRRMGSFSDALLLLILWWLLYAGLPILIHAGFDDAGRVLCEGVSDAVRHEGPAGISVWYVLRTCVTAPLMEELGCRWIAFVKMRRGFGFWPSALASAILFSLIHVDVDLKLAVAVIPSTFLYCLACELTGKLRYCVAGHVMFNILALPGTLWAGSALERCLWNVPVGIGAWLLIIVTAVIALLCAFRGRIFVRRGSFAGQVRRIMKQEPVP